MSRVQKAREGLWITLVYCVDNSAKGVDNFEFIVDKNEKIVDNMWTTAIFTESILTMPLCPTHKENFLFYLPAPEPQKMLANRESPL
jgi:hypothetical protein